MTPTMPSPRTVMSDVSLMDEMPLMARSGLSSRSLEMYVPSACGLNVFLMRTGMLRWYTGKMVGG